MTVAGIDIGTTGCKCTIYNDKGQLISESYEAYKSDISPEMHKISPSVVWEKVQEVIGDAVKHVTDLKGIGVTSFGEAAVLLDKNHEPVWDSLLFSDPNGREECQHLIHHFGTEYLNKITGLCPDIMYTIVKLMWLKNNQPKVFKKCKRICLFEDYIVYKLSGIFQIDHSLAARTMAFNVHTLMWDEAILSFAGIDKSMLPKVVPVGTTAGPIKTPLAKALGINEKTLIVSGCHDQIAAAIGTGVYKEGMVVDGTGTVECMTSIYHNRDVDERLLHRGNFARMPFLHDLHVTYAFSFTGGALLKWYREKIGALEAKANKKEDQSDYDYFNAQVDNTKPSSLLILPYFAGAGTPYMDTEAKGTILGLTLDTTKEDLYKGLMEGVTYEMRLNLERLSQAGVHVDCIRATGGGATSEIWLQMKADILKKPVTSLGAAQSGTLGCVMLAGIACGMFNSIEEAEAIFVTLHKTYYPNEGMSALYDDLYEKYKKIYPAIKNI